MSGLFGGHSGGDIHLPRGNAIKILGRILSDCNEFVHVFVGNWNGGSKHNAIPRNSSMQFAILTEKEDLFKSKYEDVKKTLLSHHHQFEKDLAIDLREIEECPLFIKEESRNLIDLMHELHHGVLKFSPQIPDLVETSNNVAIISTKENHIHIHCSSRSNLDPELTLFRRKLWEIGVLFDWKVEQDEAYPGWKPVPTSPFLAYIKEQFVKILGDDIEVEAIHAGLECGIIGAKIPGMQMVSIGPEIKNPHTPDERANIASVLQMYDVLKEIVANSQSLN